MMNRDRLNRFALVLGSCGTALAAAALAGCGSRVELGPVANARTASEIRTALGGSSDSDGGGEAAASTATGWATIRGRFVYNGTPPQMSPYNVTKDQATCSPGGRAPAQETLVVDSGTGGIRGIAIYLRDAPRVHDSAQPTDASVEFDQKACVFLSHVCGVTVGQTLEIKNSDPVGHNTNIAGSKNKFNQTIPAGESIAYKIQREEAIPAPVNCSIHPWMVAHLLAHENGYFAVTTADGSFEIANVPAGEKLELQVWHESATGPGGVLVINTPEAKSLGWSNKGRFTVTLQPDEVKDVQITVPASAFSG
jgi:plastocyanin